MEKIRLQKYFTMCGVLSRRAAEAEIAAGAVTVNGTPASIGDKIDPEADVVCWRGAPVENHTRNGHTYIMLHKPAGYVTTMSDEGGRPCVADLLQDIPIRIYPVGRLDMYSEGLLLCTDDGTLTNKLTHPSHSVPKKYMVKIKGTLTHQDIRRLTAPMRLDGYTLRPVRAKLCKSGIIDRGGVVYSTVQITLFEGRNRQIRRMCDAVGLTILRLRRTAIGNLSLGDLKSGSWRRLTEDEIHYLQNL